jgi:hypothetical protein
VSTAIWAKTCSDPTIVMMTVKRMVGEMSGSVILPK